MVWHAEDTKSLEGIPQYGSRPNKTPHSALFLKVISYDYIRYLKLNAAVFNNDAKGCSDRIIPTFGMAACQRVGMPLNAIYLFLLIIRQMQFWVRSTFGLSNGFYGNLESGNIPPLPQNSANDITILHGRIHGMMQGSSSAPLIWLLVHLVIFTALAKATPGFTASCHDNRIRSHRKGEGFVDDTDLWVTQDLKSSSTTLASLQLLARLWHTYLQISGGALGITKCFYYDIRWRWTQTGNAKMINDLHNDTMVSLVNSTDNSEIPITQVKTSSGLRTLGVRLAPDGNFQDEFKHRLEQANEITTSMKRYHYTRFEARLAYHRVWWPKMAYPLPVTNFSNAQCQKLQSTFDKTFLPRLGINRQTPKAIIHGPATLGGLSFKHVYTEQGALHASLLLYHLRQPTTEQCNQMSQIMLSHLAIESGLSASPLSIDVPMHHLRNYLLPSFLKTTWLYLHNIGAEIKSSSIHALESQRTHDIFLMDEFTSLEISGKDIRRLQRCRLFLKATRLGDITTFDGIRIHQSCLDGKPPCDRHQLKTYTKQKRPPKRDF